MLHVLTGCKCLRTHGVCNGVGVSVSNPGHFSLSGAHVRGGDINARSWSGKGGKWEIIFFSYHKPILIFAQYVLLILKDFNERYDILTLDRNDR